VSIAGRGRESCRPKRLRFSAISEGLTGVQRQAQRDARHLGTV
jgi:hypothetical protein